MSNTSPCDIKDRSRECTYSWRIKNFTDHNLSMEEGDKLRSEKFSATNDDLSWCLELDRYMINMDEVLLTFTLRPDCYDDLRKFESVSGDVTIYLMGVHVDPEGCSFTLSFDEQKRNCKVAEFDIVKIERDLDEDEQELLIFCNLTYSKKNETVTICSSNNSNAVRISESRLSSDMEKCFSENNFKDVTISVKGKEYRAHKTILAARSTVFEKLLTVDMLESKKNHIDITDVDHEPFEEMLYYIYTGKVKSLDESAFELLPLADKYDLKELTSMCEEVLVKKLTTDNAAKILILADTHRAGELKAHTLRFVKENYESCKDFNDTEFWKNLTAAGNAQLLKEMMAAFCKRQKLDCRVSTARKKYKFTKKARNLKITQKSTKNRSKCTKFTKFVRNFERI